MKLSLLLACLLLAVSIAASVPAHAMPSAGILITAVYYDPFLNGDASEAVQLENISSSAISLTGWHLSDGEGIVTFPAGARVNSSEKIWVSRSALAFRSEFGFLPAFEYGGDSDPTVPDMNGSAPSLGNDGDQVYLSDANRTVVDALVYGNAPTETPDWQGRGVQPYIFGNNSQEGQVLYRKRNEADGLPVPDTDRAADWAQDMSDNLLGKRVAYPGWDMDTFFQTVKADANASIKYCVAPDALAKCVRQEILRATSTISMEVYALDHAATIDLLAQKLDAGVDVSVLLDASALSAQGKWGCQVLEAHGGACWLMASKPQAQIHKRYDSQHGKWFVVDGQRALISSENLSDDAMPTDDFHDGTQGTRGGALITDNPEIVGAAQDLITRDMDPAAHSDVRRWGMNTDDFPPFGFVPNYANGGKGYAAPFAKPFQVTGQFPMELVQCPDNCLRTQDALLGMVARAGRGDELDIETLYEYTYWGSGTSTPTADPNLRLEAYIAAAKRGARVRILLDSFYDVFSDPRSNYRTCVYINRLSADYNIECRLANPTGRGIHLKMVLLGQGKTSTVHLGSINGSETSNKLNRELAVQVESRDAFLYWQGVFDADWAGTNFAPHRVYLPLLGVGFHKVHSN